MIDKQYVGKYIDIGSDRIYLRVEPYYDEEGYEPTPSETMFDMIRYADQMIQPAGPQPVVDDILLEPILELDGVSVLEQDELRRVANKRLYDDPDPPTGLEYIKEMMDSNPDSDDFEEVMDEEVIEALDEENE